MDFWRLCIHWFSYRGRFGLNCWLLLCLVSREAADRWALSFALEVSDLAGESEQGPPWKAKHHHVNVQPPRNEFWWSLRRSIPEAQTARHTWWRAKIRGGNRFPPVGRGHALGGRGRHAKETWKGGSRLEDSYAILEVFQSLSMSSSFTWRRCHTANRRSEGGYRRLSSIYGLVRHFLQPYLSRNSWPQENCW